MLSEKDIAEVDKANEHVRLGGEEFRTWSQELCRVFYWDSVNSDIHVMADDRMFAIWKKGISVEEFVASKK